MTTAIVDYGVGNLGSIVSMHRKLAIDAERVTDPGRLGDFDRYILPGVGAFDNAMERLDASGLRPALSELVLEERRPVLGVCLGMQLLAESSEEGRRAGLGWIPGIVRSLTPQVPAGFRLPFMGWGYVSPTRPHPLLVDHNEPQRFYFAHGYAFSTDDEHVLGTVDYGFPVAAVVGRDNVLGTQFHPEKSHRFGMNLLRDFNQLATPS
jgi:imidazole glycerol-phosphate synthase subunit HisH